MGMEDLFNINHLLFSNNFVSPKNNNEINNVINNPSVSEKHTISERKRRKILNDNLDRMKYLLNIEDETKCNTLKLMHDEILNLREIKDNLMKEKEELKKNNKRKFDDLNEKNFNNYHNTKLDLPDLH